MDREVEPVPSPPGIRETTGTLDGAGRRFVLVVARFNDRITSRLLQGAIEALTENGVSDEDVEVIRVPGAFELPRACQRVVERGGIDGIVALGCIIRGETPHFEYVSGATTRGLGALSLRAEIPVAFGVLTTDSFEQALGRAGEGESNKGREAALTALEMANLLDEIQ